MKQLSVSVGGPFVEYVKNKIISICIHLFEMHYLKKCLGKQNKREEIVPSCLLQFWTSNLFAVWYY